ncbi:helix-turn-helix domain-containing protein [Actinomadura flavalba]|uniref:helix-turn-helix domain-containing protein n=1 Tax=Actinomadura flavalba TaxID=1120938 RepID=UPI00039D8A2F|nr:helix-turn-helix domain-containing protein [Actinomadura flavalba]
MGGNSMHMNTMKTREVARLFGVTPYTVIRWKRRNLLAAGSTPSGHLRFDRAEVMELYRRGMTDE